MFAVRKSMLSLPWTTVSSGGHLGHANGSGLVAISVAT